MTQTAGPAVATRSGPGTGRWLLWTCVGVVVLRGIYVFWPLRSDEGGYLYAARRWESGAEFLYGDYHVDRPPLLMSIFRIAALTEWDPAIRVLSIPVALLFVLMAARAAHLLGGPEAARWAGLVAAAFAVSPALAADQADGEMFAVPLVMTSVVCTLEAWRRTGPRAALAWAAGAGVLASSAALVKQNFLEGFVFAGVLWLTIVVRRRGVGRRPRLVALGFLPGALLPHLFVLAWAVSSGIHGLQIWTDIAAMRGEAVELIWAQSSRAPESRALQLVPLAFVSGVLPLLVNWVLVTRERGLRVRDETRAISGCLAWGLLAIVAGGSYWPHYLLQLAPALALASPLVAVAVPAARDRTLAWIRFTAVMSVVAGLVVGAVYLAASRPWFQQRTGEWLAASSNPGDTAIIAYGNASVLEAADLETPYPYLWSLPMRVQDPDQRRLRGILSGPDAPEWIVEINDLNSWGIDEGGRLRRLVEERYDVVATLCRNPVWLRSDQQRDLAPLPDC